MKSASAPPRGGAREPGSYYWCSIWIVSIDYQSKRRDVRTAAHRWRCDGWARRKSFLLGGWAPTKLQNHDQHVSTYDQLAWITTPISISASPLLLRSIGALYCMTPTQYTRLQEARDEPLHPPTFQKSLVHRLLRPLIHPPLLLFNSLDLPHAAFCPPLFFIKDLGWGPRRRYLALITVVPLFFIKKGYTGLDINALYGRVVDYTRRYKNKIGLCCK